MKYLLTSESVDIPENVTVSVRARRVEVKGPRGKLVKEFKYTPIDIFVAQSAKKKNLKAVTLQMWMAKAKLKSRVGSVRSQIRNMIRGVTDGFKFRMRMAYNHFPIKCLVNKTGSQISIDSFLGEKRIRVIDALPDTKIIKNEEEKDTIYVQGIDLQNVSQTCALIKQSCTVKNKDIRQFLDGIYVSDKRMEM